MLLLFTYKASLSQVQQNVVGRWRAFSVQTDRVYVNLRNDSVSVIGRKYTNGYDSLQVKQESAEISSAFSNFLFEFDSNGNYTFSAFGVNDEGRYSVNIEDGIIIVKSKDSPLDNPGERTKYSIGENILTLNMGQGNAIVNVNFERLK